MNNGEHGNEFAKQEAEHMEIKNSIAATIERMRETNYSENEMRGIKRNSKELGGAI